MVRLKTTYKYLLALTLPLSFSVVFSSCSDDLTLSGNGQSGEGFKGDMVLFTAGTTNNSISTRADAKTYYMPDGGHFVCRMYHKNQNNSEDYAISNPEDAWLAVDGNAGKAYYRTKDYAEVSEADNDAGNDKNADALYWKNRRSHAFLAWTDNNKLNDIDYSDGLRFSPYDRIITTTEKKKTWVDVGFQIYGVNDSENNGESREFTSWIDVQNYLEGLSDDELEAFNNDQKSYPGTETFAESKYEHGLSCKYYVSDEPETTIEENKKSSSWIKYLIFGDKYEYTPNGSEVAERNDDDVLIFLKDANGNYLAEVEYDENDDPHYYLTDIYGKVRYHEDTPKFTFYMKRISVYSDAEIKEEYRANVYNLTCEGKTKMSEQPDILQALTIKEPLSATVLENRIDLYFKHQFSQVQVNIKNSEDNSVKIESGQIDKVELLGVTNEGYVFTELLPNGEVRPTSYKDVVATDYTDAELAENPYGTSFSMFERTMSDEEKDITKAIKSYECITFGLLQAIRITWHETSAEGGMPHASTYRVGDINLRNLASGVRYIWNMELRRGTLAVVRTEIIPWEENTEEYNTDGIINKTSN